MGAARGHVRPDGMLAAVASAIGADGDPGQTAADAVAARLRDRGPVLLVLDNMEHLLPAAGDVAALLDALPDLRVLATSQVPLRVRSELCLPLDTLDEPAGVELLRRAATRSGAPPPADDEAMLAIVRLLDGLPLALELAGARLGVLTPQGLLDRLASSTSLLKDRGTERPERHRSLDATIDWSLGLLDDDARHLFSRMGAFARPAELEHLEAAAGGDGIDVIDALAALVEVALVRRVESGDGRVRFGLPEALRRAAGERLDASPDADRWRGAHAELQRDIQWRARYIGLNSPAEVRAAAASDAEAAAAVRWARAHGHPAAARIAAARGFRLAESGHPREATEMVAPLLAEPTGDEDVDVIARHANVALLLMSDRLVEARAEIAELKTASSDPVLRSIAHGIDSFVACLCREVDEGIAEAQRGFEAAEGDLRAEVGSLLMEGQARIMARDPDAARACFEAAERRAGDLETLMLRHKATFYGDLAVCAGRPHEAMPHYARSLLIAEADDEPVQILNDLIGMATAMAMAGMDAEAVQTYSLARALSADIGDGGPASMAHLFEPDVVEAAEQRLGPEGAQRARAAGQAVPAARRVAVAYELARAADVTV